MLHKSHSAFDKYTRIHQVVTEMCTRMYISVTKWCILADLSGALCDLWDRSIPLVPSQMRPSKNLVLNLLYCTAVNLTAQQAFSVLCITVYTNYLFIFVWAFLHIKIAILFITFVIYYIFLVLLKYEHFDNNGFKRKNKIFWWNSFACSY